MALAPSASRPWPGGAAASGWGGWPGCGSSSSRAPSKRARAAGSSLASTIEPVIPMAATGVCGAGRHRRISRAGCGRSCRAGALRPAGPAVEGSSQRATATPARSPALRFTIGDRPAKAAVEPSRGKGRFLEVGPARVAQARALP